MIFEEQRGTNLYLNSIPLEENSYVRKNIFQYIIPKKLF